MVAKALTSVDDTLADLAMAGDAIQRRRAGEAFFHTPPCLQDEAVCGVPGTCELSGVKRTLPRLTIGLDLCLLTGVGFILASNSILARVPWNSKHHKQGNTDRLIPSTAYDN